MESEIKLDAIRTCLDSYSKVLREKRSHVVVINDTNIDFYNEVSSHFSDVPFDYVRTVFEDPYGLAIGMLAGQKELNKSFTVLIISQHHSVYHMTPFTLNDLFREGGDVHILLFESHIARRISNEGMPVVQDEMIESIIPQVTKLDFDFMHSFLWISEKFEAQYFAMGSAAYGEDLKQKVFNSISTCKNSIVVVHSPSVKEDDNLDSLQKAVECGFVRLFELQCTGHFKINYFPSFIPISDFFKSNSFFTGISPEQTADIQKKVYSWWESKAPGRMPHPQFIEKEVGDVDFGVRAHESAQAGEQAKPPESMTAVSSDAPSKPKEDEDNREKFGFEEIEEKDIDTLHSIPSSQIAQEKMEKTGKGTQIIGAEKLYDGPSLSGGGSSNNYDKHIVVFEPVKNELAAVDVSKPDAAKGVSMPVAAKVAPELEAVKDISKHEKDHMDLQMMIDSGKDTESKNPTNDVSKHEGGHIDLEALIDSGGASSDEGIENMLEPSESRKFVDEKLHEKVEEAKKKDGWPYYQGDDKPPKVLSGMIDSVEEEKKPGMGQGDQSSQPGQAQKKKPHSDSAALDGMLEEV